MSRIEGYEEIDIPEEIDASIADLTMRASLFCTKVMPLTGKLETTGGFSTPEKIATFTVEADQDELKDFAWYSAPILEKIDGRIVRGFWLSINPSPIVSITVGVEAAGYIWSRDVLFGMEMPTGMLSTENLLELRGFARELWGPAWEISCPDGGSEEPHAHSISFHPQTD